MDATKTYTHTIESNSTSSHNTKLVGDGGGDALYGGGTRRSSGLDGVEHPLADLLGVDLEGLNAVGGGRSGGCGGGAEGLVLDLSGGGGGFVGGESAVALGEDGGGGEGLDQAFDDGVAGALSGGPYAEGDGGGGVGLRRSLRLRRSGGLFGRGFRVGHCYEEGDLCGVLCCGTVVFKVWKIKERD